MIRRATTNDLPQLSQLFDAYRIFYRKSPDIKRAANFLNERMKENESIIFVALENGNPVGFTQLYPTYSSMRVSKNWILNDLYVDSPHRKKGIGEKLIKTAMDFAKSGGSSFVELSTAVDNFTAQSLYEQIGFKRQGPDTAFYTYRISLV